MQPTIIDIVQGERLANESIGIEALKNDRNLMLYPFCSTSKALRFKAINYISKDNKFSLEVTANNKYGMAKIWDFDILRFVFSKIDTIAKRTGYHPSSVAFSAYECLKFLGRNPNAGKNVNWLKDALDRLASTTYKGNIFKEEGRHVTGFTLVKYEYIENDKRGIEKILISLDERLVFSLTNSNSLITINERVLEEHSGLKKRLLELVALKLSLGEWVVSIEELQCLCANNWAIARFKNEVKSFQDLPWYISEVKINHETCIRFITK